MPCRWGFRMCPSHFIYTLRPFLIHTCHAMLWPCRSSQGHGTARPSWEGRAVPWEERHGQNMAIVNQTRPQCVNQMEKTHSKPLAARYGRGTAWARHVMCESAFKEFQVSLNLTSMTSTLHEDLYTFKTISPWICPRMRNVLDRIV